MSLKVVAQHNSTQLFINTYQIVLFSYATTVPVLFIYLKYYKIIITAYYWIDSEMIFFLQYCRGKYIFGHVIVKGRLENRLYSFPYVEQTRCSNEFDFVSFCFY